MTEVLLPRPGRGDPWRPGFSLPLERREEVLVGTLSFTDRLLVVAESCFSSPTPATFWAPGRYGWAFTIFCYSRE